MIRFVDKSTILAFHNDQIDRYGGTKGIRDEALFESALTEPQADSALTEPQSSSGGDENHEDIFHMAAAYGFHLCRNHPFFDGNKRTALITMYIFLYVNGYQIVADKKSLFAIMMDLAGGKVTKEELREYLKMNSEKRKT